MLRFRPVIAALCAIAGFSSVVSKAHGAEVRAAVASNFSSTVQRLSAEFTRQTGILVVTSFGSSGKLHAQIRNGAPFDVFLSGDTEQPRRLQSAGLTSGEPFTYAIGKLVLWSADPKRVDPAGAALRSGSFRHIAIANPNLAPYGAGAKAFLENLGLWSSLQNRIVMGENIAQTYQFVATGNAELGLVALSQVRKQPGGSFWVVDPAQYPPLRQDAVLLKKKNGTISDAARRFMEFLKSKEARRMILESGYGITGEEG